MNCAVCGTDRSGLNNDEFHRRILDHNDRTVIYCADQIDCGEAAAYEYLDVLAEESKVDRQRALIAAWRELAEMLDGAGASRLRQAAHDLERVLDDG